MTTDGDRTAALRATHRGRVSAALASALALVVPSGCVNPVARSLYQPAPLAAAAPEWTGRTPRLVETIAKDGVRLRGWFWPPDGESKSTP